MSEIPRVNPEENQLKELNRIFTTAARRARTVFSNGLDGRRLGNVLVDQDTDALFNVFDKAKEGLLYLHRHSLNDSFLTIKSQINATSYAHMPDDIVAVVEKYVNRVDRHAPIFLPQEEIICSAHVLATLANLQSRKEVSFMGLETPVDNLNLSDLEFLHTDWVFLGVFSDRINLIDKLNRDAHTLICNPDSINHLYDYLPTAHFLTAAASL